MQFYYWKNRKFHELRKIQALVKNVPILTILFYYFKLNLLYPSDLYVNVERTLRCQMSLNLWHGVVRASVSDSGKMAPFPDFEIGTAARMPGIIPNVSGENTRCCS